MPFRAETIRGYLQGVHALYLTDPAVKTTAHAQTPPLADIELRFKYNQDFDSIYAMVPANIALMLGLFPAILMALGVVREKELGSITNLYVTPVSWLEFLLGKQLPYVAVGLANFALLFLMALFVFRVPLKGDFAPLLLGVLLYVTAMTAYGMLISAFTNTQIAALFGTSILTVLPATQFSGMMTPVSSLAGAAKWVGRSFPMTYFVPISVGAFTKGLGFADLRTDLALLALFVPALTLLNALLLRKQEREANRGGCAKSPTSIGWGSRSCVASCATTFFSPSSSMRSRLRSSCRRGAFPRSFTTPRSRSWTRIIRSFRAASPTHSCLPCSRSRG
jgi:ribosome-dependent ATPase